ncbi:unnamed protein product [Rhizophagus irregularis]|nr:unnamed protein product [Rhizophagus irregularis]
MYGRDAVLPIEFAIETSQVNYPEDNWQDDLTKRIHTLTGKVVGDRLETQDMIYKSQQKQKQRHDADLKKIIFKIVYYRYLSMANTVNAHQKILEDLYQIFPIEVAPIMPPYDEDATMDSKFETLKEAIRRSKRLGDRRLHLVNAFFLGQFLEKKVKTNALRSHYTQQLTPHYRTTSQRVYYLFEALGVGQVMRSVNTTLTLIRKLNQEEYQDLVVRSMEIFNGVEN